MDVKEKAIMLIKAVREELRLGTKHYDQNGKLLETDKEILECLVKNQKVQVEPVEERRHLFEEKTKSG